jgi:hypothetical protein
LALVAVSLVTKPPNDATLQKFFRPVKLGKEMIS